MCKFAFRFEFKLENMISYLQIDKLTKSFGDLVLFEDITFGVAQGQKIGLIAKNGTGKTTLLNIIGGKEDYDSGEVVFRKRAAFISEFIPIFQSFYSYISQDKEQVGLTYESHARNASLLEVLKESRVRDKIMGYSLRGIHKDELNMLLGDFPIKREGSQGQNKTYLVALKLAQFDFLKRTGSTVPLLLLDDIFDKLDASRVEQIVKLVAGDNFGQIFITDTNREHLDRILYKVGSDYKMFRVESGAINEMEEKER